MLKETIKSPERIGYAAIASLALSPMILSLFHFLFVWLIGGKVDSYQLVPSSLFITGTCGFFFYYFQNRTLFTRILAVCITGIILSAGIGNSLLSIATLASILCSVGIIISILITRLADQLPEELDGLSKQYKIRTFLFLLLSIITIVLISRLSIFMNNFEYSGASVLPFIPFFKTHSCLTAYVHAIQLIEIGTENLYDPSNWPNSGNEKYAPFLLDAFMYPPPFLLLPKLLFSITNSFPVQRAVWFGFSGIFIASVFWIIAKWTGKKNEWHSIFLIFLVGSSLSVLVTLQTGNIHHVTIAMAILAMYLFEKKQPVFGGALLAFAIISKISPGLLCVVLLVQRRWKDLFWTSVFGVIYLGLSIFIFGYDTLKDFIFFEIPLLRSGQAMYWLDKQTNEILINFSPFGIPFKLGLLGIKLENSWQIAKIIGNLYTVLIVIVTVYFSFKEREPRQKVYLWSGVLTLAGLQSPFAPGYVGIPLLWAMTIIAADIKSKNGFILLVLGWICLNSLLPVPPFSEFAGAMYSIFQQFIAFFAIGILLGFKRKLVPVLDTEGNKI